MGFFNALGSVVVREPRVSNAAKQSRIFAEVWVGGWGSCDWYCAWLELIVITFSRAQHVNMWAHGYGVIHCVISIAVIRPHVTFVIIGFVNAVC